MIGRMTLRVFATALGLSAALIVPAMAQQIGTVASSEPTLRGTPPGGATRTLGLGTALVRDETVASSATGRAQLMFLDQSTLSLAPNTTIVLDRFVFDPDRGTGEIGVGLTQGALRFIGGTLSRNQPATVTTPTASIGIRGSTALVLHNNGRTIAIFIAGSQLCIQVDGQQSCTSRQGGVLTETGYAGQVSPEFLAFVLGLIDGAPLPSAGAGPGTGVGGPNPPGRGPVSTLGEEFDFDLFDDDFTIDDVFEWLGEIFFYEECIECSFD